MKYKRFLQGIFLGCYMFGGAIISVLWGFIAFLFFYQMVAVQWEYFDLFKYVALAMIFLGEASFRYKKFEDIKIKFFLNKGDDN